MNTRYLAGAGSVLALALAAMLPRAASAAEANLDCELKFSLTGWAVIYKHAEGHGVITCKNGKSMDVKIEAKGGGLTAGKSHIDNGTGRFTDVHRIEDTLGTYAQGDASIGAGGHVTSIRQDSDGIHGAVVQTQHLLGRVVSERPSDGSRVETTRERRRAIR